MGHHCPCHGNRIYYFFTFIVSKYIDKALSGLNHESSIEEALQIIFFLKHLFLGKRLELVNFNNQGLQDHYPYFEPLVMI